MLTRGGQLQRRKRLERRTRIRQRREQRRRSERVYDARRREWTLRQPCCARDLPGHRCFGRIEGDHAGERPLGRKASDDTMIALCQLGHRQRTDSKGPWAEMTPAERRAWREGQIAEHQRRYAAELAGPDLGPPAWRPRL